MTIKVDFQIIDPVSNQTIKAYSLNLEPSRVLIEVDEARAVWDEYHVVASSQGSTPFVVYKTQTYKQEMMERQYMMDLHYEVCDQDFE
jgi:hypothetical protein